MKISDEMVDAALAAFAAGQHPANTSVEDRMAAALEAIAPMILDEAAKMADGFGWQQQRFVSDRLEAAFDRADEIAAAIRAMGER